MFVVAPRCDRNEPSLDDVRELPDAFQTSLSATAIRFVELCPEPCAAVVSRRGHIEWAVANDDFVLPLYRGHPVSDTYADDLLRGRPVDDRPHAIEAFHWTTDQRFVDRELVEHSIRLGGFDAVLSVLWHPYDGP